jgi:hypothetical protein
MNKRISWLLLLLAGLIIFGGMVREASANYSGDNREAGKHPQAYLPEITPMPTDSVSVSVNANGDRQLPPVGSNSGLVIGASVLVLIIIGGVLGSRRRIKH